MKKRHGVFAIYLFVFLGLAGVRGSGSRGGGAVVEIVKAISPARKIAVYRTGDVVRVEVEGAGRGDIPAAVKAAKERGMEDAE